MTERPAATVIVSTYNWSSALRCALRSVQLQTLADIEVLVVGDGCTDDSAAVVASLADPRFRWHNLPENTGSQSGPNNAGLALARAEWVAYLGQDDIWHPRHLEVCLAAAAAQGADLIASATIMYGPPGSGWRAMSGLLVDGTYGPRDFMPPSSWLHRKAVATQIGSWKDPAETLLPVDATFLKEAAEARARIGGTDEVTVFKFNAAWRRDAYRLRPTGEQEAMIARIETGEDFRARELLDVMRAVAADRYVRTDMPLPPPPSELSYFRRNRLHKGAEERFAREALQVADGPMRFRIDEPGHFQWHGRESSPVFGTFRWTGPSPRAEATLPVLFDRPLSLELCIVHAIEPAALDRLKLFVQGVETPHVRHRDDTGVHILHCGPIPPPAEPGPLEITFDVGQTKRPYDVSGSTDRRWLGVAVAWVEVRPA
jgi:glycosyltransferase involved in cell wall biosynthesis